MNTTETRTKNRLNWKAIRRGSVIWGILLLIAAFMIHFYLKSQRKDPPKNNAGANHPVVSVINIQAKNNTSYMTLTGRLMALDKVEVYAEVTGRLVAGGKQFKEGNSFRKGEAMLRLNNADSELSLIAARAGFQSTLTQLQADLATDYPDNYSKWEDYLAKYDPEKSIPALPRVVNKQEKNFLVARNIYNQYYNIKSLELQNSKFTVYAPFSGVVINANVTPGTLVRAGQKVGEFIGTEAFELEVGLNIDERDKVFVGNIVELTSDDRSGRWMGTVNRISNAIDPTTQTYKAYIKVKAEELSEGMYMEATFINDKVPSSVKLASHLVYDNAFVYGVQQDSVMYKVPVNIVGQGDGYVLVTGLTEGMKIIGTSVTNPKPGMIVKVTSTAAGK